ncbi:MAG: hypothetical protein IPM29_06495 [Planctomycetes bacterium]|nr:hypothetical protein [Planctomycetota bacterium]
MTQSQDGTPRRPRDLRRRRAVAHAARVVAGLAIWSGLGTAAWRGVDALRETGEDPLSTFIAAVRGEPGEGARQLELSFDGTYWTRVGDPIFAQGDGQPFVQIGVITAMADANGPVHGRPARWGAPATAATARLFATAPPIDGRATVAWYGSDLSLAWVVRTMLPPARQERLRELVQKAIAAHSEELLASLQPLVKATLTDALHAVEIELPRVLAEHREELQALGLAYQDELVHRELVPLVKEEVFPLLEERASPLVTTIGREIWSRVSLWSLGSRWVWDRLPLTSGQSLEREWNRLLTEEALPVIASHTDDLLGLVQQVSGEVFRNERVRRTLRDAYGRVLEDARVHALLWSVFREAVVGNQRLQQALADRWQSERTQAALSLASQRLQPTVEEIAALLFGRRGEGISPEFAAVLRNRLLFKDRTWFVLRPGAGTAGAATGAPLMLRVALGDDGADPFAVGGGR